MTLSSHRAELEKMIKGFRVSDLQTLLIYAGKNKGGKKSELQARALDLIRQQVPNTAIEMKIRELYRNRYAQTHGHADPPEIYPPDMYSHGFSDPVGNTYSVGGHKSPIGSSVLPTNFMQPYNQMRSNPSMNVIPQYPVNPDVQFKDLPFYDILNELLKPTSLVPIRNDGIVQEKEFMFYLEPQDVRELNSDPDVQVQFRIGCLENNQEQDDEYPSSVCIKVNTKVSALPNPIPTNKPGVEAKRPKKPLDITSLIKRTSAEPQLLGVSWASSSNSFKPYVTAVYLVRKQTSSVLIRRLKDNGVGNPDHTTAIIKEKLNVDRDTEIATMSLRGSLVCPLGKIKMTLPCRALTCSHLQCFDATLYVQMNEKKPKWICPVCDKPAVFKSLAIDGLFLDITRKVPPDCTEVQFHEDGSWTPIIPVKKTPEVKEVVPVPKVEKPKKSVEVVDLDLDSDTEDSWTIEPPKKKLCKPVGVINPVVLDNCNTSITVEPTLKSYDALQPCSSKSILSTSKINALPAEKNTSQNSSNFSYLYSSSSKDFESTYSPQSPANQSSASSTFQEPVDILSPSSTAGQCYDFDLYSLMQPTENLPYQLSTDETVVEDTPDIISID